MRLNTTLDDIAAVVGFTAAVRLAAFYGGKNLYIAAIPAPGQVLTDLIGLSCARAMANEWGGETVAVPCLAGVHTQARAAKIAKLHSEGLKPTAIAEAARCGQRRVQQVVSDLKSQGVIPDPKAKKRRKKVGFA